MRKLTTEDFIIKSNIKHSNKYDYSCVEYTNSNIKVIIICPIHGKFKVNPSQHMNMGHGCRKCANDAKRSNLNEFIKKANIKHNYKFDYSKANYINSLTKVIVICRKHGEFKTRPDMHINEGHGCRKCKNENMIKTNDDFIKECKEIHEDHYLYTETIYSGIYNKVKIICKKHGEFYKTPSSILSGRGCNKCCINGKLDKKTFIEKANKIHEHRYNYDNINYINSRTKVDILCYKHGIFSQLSNNHLQGHGCPICDKSIGEIEIENFLIKNNIKYKTQFTFEDLRYKYPLKFDFAIIDENNNLNYLIEFNGKQHYDFSEFMHRTIDYYNDYRLRDKMKIEYCYNNNIKLYIIKYDDNVKEYMKKINENPEQPKKRQLNN